MVVVPRRAVNISMSIVEGAVVPLSSGAATCRGKTRAGMGMLDAAMGTLTYDSKLTATFDDRILAHLQVVIWAKVRRGEQFSFSWSEPQRNGYGRTSIWISPTISLAFEYFGSRPPAINKRWVELLTKSANSPSGLHIVPEPDSASPVE